MSAINVHTKYSMPFRKFYFLSISSRQLCTMLMPQLNAFLASEEPQSSCPLCHACPQR